MAAKAQYKIILRGKRGGFAKLARAVTFEIYYGKRKVLSETFGRLRAIKSKKAFLQILITKIEKRRLSLLGKKRRELAAARKKKEAVFVRQRERARQRRIITKRRKDMIAFSEFMRKKPYDDDELFKRARVVIPQPLEDENKDIEIINQFLEDELMDFESAFSPEVKNMKNWSVTNSTVIPIQTELKDYYAKEVIFKDIEMSDGRLERFEIVNMDLNENIWVEITKKNFISQYYNFFVVIVPHLRKIWQDYHKFYNSFLFRLKVEMVTESGEVIKQGISVKRKVADVWEHYLAIIFSTYMKIRGIRGLRRTRNYLDNIEKFYITGFSMEMS